MRCMSDDADRYDFLCCLLVCVSSYVFSGGMVFLDTDWIFITSHSSKLSSIVMMQAVQSDGTILGLEPSFTSTNGHVTCFLRRNGSITFERRRFLRHKLQQKLKRCHCWPRTSDSVAEPHFACIHSVGIINNATLSIYSRMWKYAYISPTM